MRPRDRAALILVAIALAFATLAVGGAPRWAACGAALLGVASAIPYVTSRRTSSRMSPLLWPLAAAAALTALQLVPLPAAIAEQVAPAKLTLVIENEAAWGAPPPAWVMASYDPPATLVELAKLVGYLALAWTCVRLASHRRARRYLAMIAAGVATLAAVVTLAHQLLGLSQLYGWLDTRLHEPPTVSPIVSPNHLASFLSIAAPIAIALAAQASGPGRLLWFASALTLTGVTLLTGSRGGAIGLAIGLGVVVTLLVIQRRAGTDSSARRVPLSVAVPAAIIALSAVVLVGIFTAGEVAKELASTGVHELSQPTSKFGIWGVAAPLAVDHAWMGVGRGAFEPAFTALAPTGAVVFSHAENSYLQAAIDWGLVGAMILAILLISAARTALSRWRHGPIEAGALAGIAALAVHDVADFSIELPAVATLALVATALVLPERMGITTAGNGRTSHVSRKRAVTRAALLLAGALVVALAASSLGRTAREDAARVTSTPPDERLATARAAMIRHPSDYLLIARVAEALFEQRDPRAVRVMTRALERNAQHAGLHHLTARMLAASQRPQQAAVEYAMALRWARDPAPIIEEVRTAFPDPVAAARALPVDLRSAERIQRVIKPHRSLALEHARRVAEVNARAPDAHALLASAAISAGHADVAVPAARSAWEGSRTARNATLLGRALALAGDLPRAITAMREAYPLTTSSRAADRFELSLALAEIELTSGDLAAARSTLQDAEALAQGASRLQALWHDRMAAVEGRAGNSALSEWHRARAEQARGGR